MGNVDGIMIPETKIDNSFVIDSFSTPYIVERDSTVGGILLYVREDIS